MNRYIKKIAIGITSLSLLFSSFTYSFADNNFLIYDRRNIENISSGIVHEHIQQFRAQGWWNINVLWIDLDDEYTELGTLISSKGISSREKLTDMMKKENAVAAINGDFFDTLNNHSSPLGATVNNGKLISSPNNPQYALPVFSLDKDKNPLISYWDMTLMAIPEGGEPIILSAVNKESKFHEEIILYDKNWGLKSLGNISFNDMIEIVIVDDIVKDVKIGQEPVEIPENGYVLSGRGKVKDTLLNNFKIGQNVKLEINTNPNYEKIAAAIGGGSILVKDGKISDFKINIKGNHPRTALGITKDKKKLMLVTIDGRDTSFKGVSQEVLADIMISLGAYDAINFDGGGSTTMAVKSIEDENPKIVNKPSDGSERSIVNGLGVFNNAPQSSLSYIKIFTEDTKMFVNTTRTFYVKGYDKYHNPVEINEDKVKFYIEGIEGDFDDNKLIALKPGIGTVKAKYGSKTDEIQIQVLDEIEDIEFAADKFSINTSSEKDLGTIYGKDKEGYTAIIEPNDIDWTITGNIGSVKDGIFYSSDKAGAGAITAKIQKGVESILVSVGYKEIQLEDFDDLDNIKLTTYPENVTGKISLSSKSKEGKKSVKLQYDFTETDATRAAYIKFGDDGIQLKNVPQKIGMWVYGYENGNWLRGTITDSNNKTYNIDFTSHIDWKGWKWVTADIPAHITSPITLNRIYVVEINPMHKDESKIYVDDLKALYPSSFNTMVLPISTKVEDEKNKKVEVEENGYKFILTNGIDNLDNLLKYQIANKIKDEANESDLAIFMGNLNNKFLQEISNPTSQVTNGYFKFTHKDTLFIQLDDTEGGIRSTNPTQWIELKNSLENASEKNIFLLMPKPIFGDKGFTDKMEADLLHEILSEYKLKGKDIWVIYQGDTTDVELRDGIRYMSIENKIPQNTSEIFDLKYIQFTVNNGDITYEILPLYE